MKLYAVLWVPEFSLQAILRHAPHLVHLPVALLGKIGSKCRVSEINIHAQAHQVRLGMTPTQALARCAELHLLNSNSGHERSAQGILLQTAETFSAFFESTAPGVVTVELPSERSFTEAEFLERCVHPLSNLGLVSQVGVGNTPDLAFLAARFAQPVLLMESTPNFPASLPVQGLKPSAELGSVLNSWGIRTIGQFLALPLTELSERLGQEAVTLWEQATGSWVRPLKRVKPQQFFVEQVDLEQPIELLEPLLLWIRRFLEQITLRLARRYWVVGKIRLILQFEKGEPYQRIFTIPQPTGNVEVLFRLLHTHLENFTSPFPITGLELAAQPTRPGADQFELLEKGLRDPARFGETLGRLQALLGADRVGSPKREPSHHPEAFHLRPYNIESSAPAQKVDQPIIGLPWLRFRPAVPANVTLKERKPVFLCSSRCNGPVWEACGPWLREGHWWENKCWSREEWDVETESGIFRLVRTNGDWVLDGVYGLH